MKVDIDSIREEIQDKLVDYLKRQNIEIITNGSRKFRCINPKHNDRTPSASIVPNTNERFWHCFGCGIHSDIFTAAHYLEKKPLDGPGFIEDNVLYLANLYHIKVPVGQLSEEDTKRWRMRRAYQIAYQYMLSSKEYSQAFQKEIEKRQWPIDRVKDLGVGQIANYSEFREYMFKQDGLDSKLLEEIDLLGPRAEWMFNENKMLFALLDEYGRPCGFAARNLDYIKSNGAEKDPNGPKYKNTASVGLYEKRKFIYNIDQAKRFQQDPVFILEGQADVIASRLAGLDNVVALGGTALTDEHIILMRSLGLTRLVLALDGDKTGTDKTGEMITKLGDYPGIRVDILRLPPNDEEKDVDGYIRKNGPNAWAQAQANTVTAFRWQLQNRAQNEDKYIALDKAIKSIIPIQFPAQIYQMCEELSKELDLPLDLVREEVKTHKNMDGAQREAEMVAFSDSVKKQIERRPQDIKAILTRANNYLSTIDKRVTWNPIDSSDQVNKLVHHIQREDEASDNHGILMGWPEFDSKMHGIPSNDTWIVLGGKANCFFVNQEFLDPRSGSMVLAKDLYNVSSINNNVSCHSKITDYIDSGDQECFEVITDNGFKVITTDKHKYLTPTGWKELKDLNINDKIAQPSILNNKVIVSGYQGLSEEEGLFLGLMIGDGNFTQERPLFFNDDPVILDTIKTTVVNIFGNNIQCPVYEKNKNNNPTYEMISFTQKDWKTNRDAGGRTKPNPIISWFKDLKLYGKTAHHKFLPREVFLSFNNNIKQLLIGLFSTDGSIQVTQSKGYNRCSIDYCSASEKLIRQVQHLLLRFGIVASIRKRSNKCQTGVFPSWYLTIRDQEGVSRFIKNIGFVPNSRKDLLAQSWQKPPVKSFRYDRDIYWGKIKSITPVGILPTCDITVENTHNFCIDGFVLHNSGKSSMCANMIYNGLKNNPDLIGIIYTIDDSYGRFLPRLISLDTGLRSSWISKRKLVEQKRPGIINKIQTSYNYFQDLMRKQRLYIWDIRDGNTWTFASKQLEKLRQDNPKAKILMVLDNFHLLQDFTGGESVQNYARLSNMVANTVKEQEIALISTVEYHKLKKRVRPENQSIHYTQQLEYDSHLILHMLNYSDEFGDQSKLYWNSKNPEDQVQSFALDGSASQVPKKKPIVELTVGKSKLEEFKGNIFFEFDPARCKFNECNTNDQKHCRDNYFKHPWLFNRNE